MQKVDVRGKKISSFWTFYDHDENYSNAMKVKAKNAKVLDGLSLPRTITSNTKKLENALELQITV